VFFVAFPFMTRAHTAAGFVALVFVAVSGAACIGPKTAIVHCLCAGPAQVVAMPAYNSFVTLGGFIGPFVTVRGLGLGGCLGFGCVCVCVGGGV
jgi:hypothetical protein